MATELSNFTSETQIGTTTTLVSTTSTEKKFIGKAVLTNTSTSAVEVTIWRLLTSTTPTSGSGGNWLDKRTIQPGKIWIVDSLTGQALGNSMSVKATAGTASVVNANLSGAVES
jgi:hypothetical protein